MLLSALLCTAVQSAATVATAVREGLVNEVMDYLRDEQVSSTDKEPAMLGLNRFCKSEEGTQAVLEADTDTDGQTDVLILLLGLLRGGNDRDKYNAAKILARVMDKSGDRGNNFGEDFFTSGGCQLLLNMVNGGDVGQVRAANMALGANVLVVMC